jgi:hypothetical protein
MNNKEQYAVVVARCEATTRGLEHALGMWYPVSEHLRASLCKACGAMVWVTRSGTEQRWRIGGTALEQECFNYDLGTAAGGCRASCLL